MGKCVLYIVVLIIISLMMSMSSNSKHALALTMGNETDRLALLAIKDQLALTSSLLRSWNASLNFCDWPGVGCGRRRQRQRVISLTLPAIKFGGSISPSIGNLTFLGVVDLSINELQGNIPKELGQLRHLRLLNLSYNNLQGNIPVELGNCSNLQSIHLDYNNLTGKISLGAIDNSHPSFMNNLVELSLRRNNLYGGIPSSLGNFSSLRVLQLGRNDLKGMIPKSLGRLSSLERLVINDNNLSGTIPSSIYNLSSLTYIHMTGNQLSGILDPEIGSAFPRLEVVYLGLNKLSGTIPRSVTNISTLAAFDIASNDFSGLVPDNMGNLNNLVLLSTNYNNLGSGEGRDLDFIHSLTNCTKLKLLAIHKNRLSGVLPSSVANLSTQLYLLYMAGNQIYGSIPQGIGNLVNLTSFHVGTNFLTGNVPTSIGKLRNLQLFDLSVNRLSGEIPSSIGNLSRLSSLYLDGNRLEGQIPVTLSNCKDMQVLDLSGNELGGGIPKHMFAAFERLTTLNLSRNSFTGLFPSDIGDLKNLVELNVDNNNFVGEIPMVLGQISALRIIRMQGNHFQGSIPSSFRLLRSIEILDLSANNLSGTVPPELENLPFLESLNLSFNQLEGDVPTQGVFRNISGISIIGNKKLCGGIPELKLPKCPNKEGKKKGNVVSTKVIVILTLIGIILLIASIVLVLFGVLRWRKCSRKEMIAVASPKDGYFRVAYKEILRATNDFASFNLIGQGSFGSVYRGILHQQEYPVAVKVLNLQNLGAIKSFKVECEVLRKARHRNLVKVITSCSSIDYQGNDFKALVLEFMPNGSLESWLHYHDQHLNFDQMLDIAIDVANALDYLHHHCETQIVHRDLKPSNVLLDDDMVAHVSDFGMAKFLSKATSNLASDQATSSFINGTIGYVAPEYGMGSPASPEGDIYSFGILLLEMITGKRPTDDLFADGLSLHNFCKLALPGQVKEITDSRLIEQQFHDHIINWKGLVAFAEVGIACSLEIPVERMKIEDAITQLLEIKAEIKRRSI